MQLRGEEANERSGRKRHCEFDMETIKLKPQILTKEFNNVPQSQRTPKVKDKGEPKERGTMEQMVASARERKRI